MGIFERSADGRVPSERLLKNLGMTAHPEQLAEGHSACRAPQGAEPPRTGRLRPERNSRNRFRSATLLPGKNILLIGVTGFIGKVWLAQILSEVPQIGKIYLLIRRQRTTTSQRRFEKLFEESPVFDPLQEQHGDDSRSLFPNAWK